jgi:hypothetical protein
MGGKIAASLLFACLLLLVNGQDTKSTTSTKDIPVVDANQPGKAPPVVAANATVGVAAWLNNRPTNFK